MSDAFHAPDGSASPPQDPGYWSAHFAYDPARAAVWKELAALIQEDIPAGAELLDLGAGYCYFVNHVRARTRHALDLDERLADYAGPGVQVHVGACTKLDMFPAESLDVVFASNMFEHLTRDEFEQTIAEVRRVLRPGGRLLVMQPNYRLCQREYFDDYTHKTVFTDWSLSHWLQARGFRISRMVARFIPGDFRSSKPKWPWLVRLYLRLPFRPFAQQMYCVAERT